MLGSLHERDGVGQYRCTARGNHIIERKAVLQMLKDNVGHVPESQESLAAAEFLYQESLIDYVFLRIRIQLLEPFISRPGTAVRPHGPEDHGAKDGSHGS